MKNLKDSPILHNTVGGVLAGLILLLITSYLLPAVGNWVKAFTSWLVSGVTWLWNKLESDVSLPYWIILIALVVFFFCVGKFLKRISGTQKTAQPAPTPATAPEIKKPNSIEKKQPEFTNIENSILKALAAAQGRHLDGDELLLRVKEPPLRMDQALESLYRRGYIDRYDDVLYGTKIHLTGKGRDLVIEKGYA